MHAIRRVGKPGQEGMDQELETLVGRRPEFRDLCRPRIRGDQPRNVGERLFASEPAQENSVQRVVDPLRHHQLETNLFENANDGAVDIGVASGGPEAAEASGGESWRLFGEATKAVRVGPKGVAPIRRVGWREDLDPSDEAVRDQVDQLITVLHPAVEGLVSDAEALGHGGHGEVLDSEFAGSIDDVVAAETRRATPSPLPICGVGHPDHHRRSC